MTRLFGGVFLALTVSLTAGGAHATTLNLTYPSDYEGIGPGGTLTMQVACPTGTTVVSGGWDTNAAFGPFFNVSVSKQSSNNGWTITVMNTHTTATLAINVFAVCASSPTLTLSSYSASQGPTHVAGMTSNFKKAFCTNGGIPTGGGFESSFPNPANLLATETYPDSSQNQWTSREYNSTTQDKTFNVYITCTKGLNGSLTQRNGTQVQVNPGTQVSAPVDCVPGDYAIGGGYVNALTSSTPQTNWRLVRTFGNVPTAANEWTARVANANTFDFAWVTPVAQCLHLN